MDAKRIIELLEETNQLSAFTIEVATDKGTLKMSFTPSEEVKKEEVKEENKEKDLSFLKDLTY